MTCTIATRHAVIHHGPSTAQHTPVGRHLSQRDSAAAPHPFSAVTSADSCSQNGGGGETLQRRFAVTSSLSAGSYKGLKRKRLNLIDLERGTTLFEVATPLERYGRSSRRLYF